MNESVFRELLSESLRREYAGFDNAPEHKFSLGHRLSMKRIFARYEKNVRGQKNTAYIPARSEDMPYYGLKQRIIIALVIVVLMTLLTGWFIPIRGITEAQVDWLRSRYDFSVMKIDTGELFVGGNGLPVGLFRETDEYGSFLADLEYLGIYSAEEVDHLRLRTMPIDTRPEPTPHENLVEAITMNLSGESPLDIFRSYVSDLERKIGYYNERAKDPARAVEGDADFADVIAEHYLPLPKSFLELLEKLFAENPDDEDENQRSHLSDLDKDDRTYLSEINKI